MGYGSSGGQPSAAQQDPKAALTERLRGYTEASWRNPETRMKRLVSIARKRYPHLYNSASYRRNPDEYWDCMKDKFIGFLHDHPDTTSEDIKKSKYGGHIFQDVFRGRTRQARTAAGLPEDLEACRQLAFEDSMDRYGTLYDMNESMMEAAFGSEPGPVEAVILDEAFRIYEYILSRLSDMERYIVESHTINDRPMPEISHELGITRGMAYYYEKKAMQKLKAYWKAIDPA